MSNLEKLTVVQLKEIASELNIPKYNSMRKAELISAISAAQGQAVSEAKEAMEEKAVEESDDKIHSQVGYQGQVNIAYRLRGKTTIKKITKNHGLLDMSLIYAKMMSGNFSDVYDAPRYIELGFKENNDPNGQFNTILVKPVPITGREYYYADGNWQADLVATIYHSDLNSFYYTRLLSSPYMDYDYYLRMTTPTQPYKYLAEMAMDTDSILNIKDDISAIIVWNVQLLLDSTSENSITNVTTE